MGTDRLTVVALFPFSRVIAMGLCSKSFSSNPPTHTFPVPIIIIQCDDSVKCECIYYAFAVAVINMRKRRYNRIKPRTMNI